MKSANIKTTNGSAKKNQPAKAPAKKQSKKAPAKKAAPKKKVGTIKKAAAALKEIVLFGFPVTSVARRLHAAGMKPNEVVRAIQAQQPKAPTNSLRNCCRTGQKAVANLAVATLKKEQLATLKKAGAAPVAA
jgi:hypothetical protein